MKVTAAITSKNIAYCTTLLTVPYAVCVWGEGVRVCERTPLAGQIISKSCSFSSGTEFIPLILTTKSEFSRACLIKQIVFTVVGT